MLWSLHQKSGKGLDPLQLGDDGKFCCEAGVLGTFLGGTLFHPFVVRFSFICLDMAGKKLSIDICVLHVVASFQ